MKPPPLEYVRPVDLDIHLSGMEHAAVLRSPHAHARIKSINTTRAKALPGVIPVMTGAEAA